MVECKNVLECKKVLAGIDSHIPSLSSTKEESNDRMMSQYQHWYVRHWYV